MRLDIFLPFLRKPKKGTEPRPDGWLLRTAKRVLPSSLFANKATGKPGRIRRWLKRRGPTVLPSSRHRWPMASRRMPRTRGYALMAASVAMVLVGLPAPAHADELAQSESGRPALRLAAALGSARFVAYTPTDLTIVSGQVRAASSQAVRADLEILRRDFDGLVTYSCVDGVEQVPLIASELGYRALILGIWDPLSERETANAVRLARAFPDLVVGVAVGNETLLAQRHDWDTLRAAMQRLRAALPEVAIATSERSRGHRFFAPILGRGCRNANRLSAGLFRLGEGISGLDARIATSWRIPAV